LGGEKPHQALFGDPHDLRSGNGSLFTAQVLDAGAIMDGHLQS
jgi:hypothetical protein